MGKRDKTGNYKIAEDGFSSAVCKLFCSLLGSALGQEGEQGFEEVQFIPCPRRVVSFWVELCACTERTSRAICTSFCSLPGRSIMSVPYGGIFPFCS